MRLRSVRLAPVLFAYLCLYLCLDVLLFGDAVNAIPARIFGSSLTRCRPGSRFKDKCNICRCGDNGISKACTLMYCGDMRQGPTQEPF